jgi:hypothetical protein
MTWNASSGQVPLDLVRELDGLGTEAVAKALLVLLRRHFARLGQPEVTAVWEAGIGARIGEDIVIRILPGWRVLVNSRRSGVQDRKTVKQVRDAVTGLLTKLGNQALRQHGGRKGAK